MFTPVSIYFIGDRKACFKTDIVFFIVKVKFYVHISLNMCVSRKKHMEFSYKNLFIQI